MKRLTTKWMIAAAALVVAAGSASAQNLKADIPFTFHAGSALMGPGTYAVNFIKSNSRPYILLWNADTRQSALLAQYTASNPSKEQKAAGVPKLQFECAGARCVLRELWQGSDNSAYHFQGPKLGPGEDVHIAEIAMTRVKAD